MVPKPSYMSLKSANTTKRRKHAPKSTKKCRNHPGNPVNRKTIKFYIETVSNLFFQLPKNIFSTSKVFFQKKISTFSKISKISDFRFFKDFSKFWDFWILGHFWPSSKITEYAEFWQKMVILLSDGGMKLLWLKNFQVSKRSDQ